MVLRAEAQTSVEYDFEPTGSRIFVERVEAEETTKSGLIYIPETAKEKANEGVVRAIGPGRRDENGKRIEMERRVGDRVLFGKYTGTEVAIGETTYVLMSEEDVICVLREKS